ncbi:MAG: hypothetical protein IJR21_05145, partial [Synergistaceae bacterium]|nr:hypothetical protein [Synergistaceae bacterium]
PWNTCGVYVSSVLGVATLDYLPYCFMNWLNPLVALVMTYFGLAIIWRQSDEDKMRAIDREAVIETIPALGMN